MDTEVKVLGVGMHTRARRRVLVVMVYASYFLVLAPFWLAHHAAKQLLALAVPAFLLWAACFWALSRVARAYTYPSHAGAGDLADERQAQVRDRSFAQAYWIFSSLVCLGLLYWQLAKDFAWPLVPEGSLTGLLFFLILLSATLPSSVVTWNEGDDADHVAEQALA